MDGVKEVKLFNEDIEVRCQIDTLPGISGHADKAGLLDWYAGFEQKPKLVFVNHGDPEAAESFVACLEAQGQRAYAPYSGCVYDLKADSYLRMPEGKPIEKKSGGRKVSSAFLRLFAAAERLLKVAKSIEGRPNKELAAYADRITHLADKMEK